MPNLKLPDGRTLAWEEAGAGAPLILVHGSPGQGRSWARVVAHLSDRYRVLTPDLPGYGRSDPLPEGTTERTAAMGEAIAALVEIAGDRVRLCGHSYGGNVALHAATMLPDALDRLVLFEPVFFRALDLAQQNGALAEASGFFMAYAERVTGGEAGAVSQMIDFWFGPGAFTRLPPPVQEFLRSAAAKNGIDVRASFAETLSKEALAQLQLPVLIATGDASPPTAPAIAQALAGLLPNATVRTIAGANHGMLDGHAKAVAELIAQ